MKAGKVVKTFSTRDGRQMVLRFPRWEDLDDLLDLINSLVDERANIVRDKRVARDEEIDWLSRALASMEKDEIFYLVAEADGNVIANSEICRRAGAYEQHVGVIGIAIRGGFRDLGIGTEMMNALTTQGRTMGMSVLELSVFANNERAIRVYKKVGFAETGRVPRKFFKEGKYMDEIIMTKLME
jgi:RimJ/RimL family protein N-acetyltransferase